MDPTEEELAGTLAMTEPRIADIASTIAAKTIAKNPRSTIEPPDIYPSAAGRQALDRLGDERTAAIAGGLDMGETIGEGGMGIVRAAMQRSLGRRVAVKTLRPGAKNDQTTLRLLREAWVTGALEHPNIVPVYDLGLAEDASPIIVLKHIEGRGWSELIANAAEVKARFGADDLLEHNLRILVQLCNAVSLAHSRGILHRDLKPENVMIGRFGEVYLVDWGIAVSLRDDPTGRLPLASASKEMAGTPAYMAPEMLGAVGSLEERTDVYLLGAILHEILVARPPHVGSTFTQIVSSILLSDFTFPESVPSELAAIAKQAMSRLAQDRFASADELRQKLEWYLRHRGSLLLSAEASRRLHEMRHVISRSEGRASARERVHHLFAEARFGFRQALRASGDNTAAAVGLREATGMVVAFELDAGQPEAAAAALAELEEPPPELSKRVADAMAKREAERRRVASLERLSADLDPSTGRRTRMTVALIMGAIWTAGPEICGGFYRQQKVVPDWTIYAITIGVLAVAVLVRTWGRESLSKTIVNRRSQAIVMLMFAAQLTVQLGGRLLGLPLVATFALYLYGWFFSVCAFAVFVDRRFWPSAPAFFVAFLVACGAPDYLWHAMSAANLVLTANFMFAWMRPESDAGFFMLRMRERAESVRSLRKSRPPEDSA